MTKNTEEAVAWTGLRYVRADPTDEQRAAICETDLVKQGDTVLVWINEGDLYMPDARVAVAEAENAKLRALSEEAIRLMNKYAREAGEATGKLETSELAGIVDDWKARALKAEAALEEAAKGLEPFAAFGGKLADYEQFSGKSATTQWAEHFRRARATLTTIREKTDET